MLDTFKNEVLVSYRNEVYRVRDNGAIYRLKKDGRKKRRYDTVWTFGNESRHHPYLTIASERVHRIVATAFHGKPPQENYIVDHIDTNCRNNRPENLRWVSRLENALLNPITRKRIVFHCGSIERFLDDPSILRDAKLSKNFEWMRTVTKEEAQNFKKNILKWSKRDSKRKFICENDCSIEELLFQQSDVGERYRYVKSLTKGCLQYKWIVPTYYPCCPTVIKEDPINEYFRNITKGELFAFNDKYPESYAVKCALVDGKLFVLCFRDSVKPWGIVKIEFLDSYYIHSSYDSFFTEKGAEKVFALLQGFVWEGGDSIDDFC